MKQIVNTIACFILNHELYKSGDLYICRRCGIMLRAVRHGGKIK